MEEILEVGRVSKIVKQFSGKEPEKIIVLPDAVVDKLPEISQAVEAVVDKLPEISQAVEAVVDKLPEISQAVDKLPEVITEVAETNLCCLFLQRYLSRP